MFSRLTTYLHEMESKSPELPDHRKGKLKKLAEFVRTSETARLIFICTHNSRRSQLCQVWSQAIAHYFELENMEAYSGGTEVTAFHPHAIAALRRAGFQIDNPGGENPRCAVFYAEEAPPVQCFSKTYDHDENPRQDFAAVMTCSEADEDCPYVPGATLRVSLPYKDPKESDGTAEQEQVYDERCRQIASEMFYMVQQCGKAT